MAEYIEKEYAVDAVLDVYYDTPDINLSGEKFEAAILKIQAADVAPVRHGRWVKTKEPLGCYDVDCVSCSVCNESWVVDEDTGFDFLDIWKYCPSCGTAMDLEE